MKIVHFSDPHTGGWPDHWSGYFDKRILGCLNYNLKRREMHHPANFTKAVDVVLAQKPDVVICTGDITSVGQPAEFEQALSILDPLIQSDIPFLYVPGNHDAYVGNKRCREALVAAFNTINAKQGISFDSLPAVWSFGGVEFLLVNEARPTLPSSSCGYLKKGDVEAIEQMCNVAEQARVFIGHYPLIEPFSIKRLRRRLWGQNDVVELLNHKTIDLALCGHIHSHYASLDESGRGETCAGSVTKQRAFSLIEYSHDTNSFSLDRISF